VLSHIRIAPSPDLLSTVRIGLGEADLIVGFDLVTAAGPAALIGAAAGRTRAVVDRHVVPTAAFVKNNSVDLKAESLLRIIGRAVQAEPAALDATGLATGIIGDAIAANMLLMGFAWQRGLVPVSLEALTTAIEMNGVAIAMNTSAFALGRLAAHDPASPRLKSEPAEVPEGFEARLKRRADFLTAYQDAAYAARFTQLVRSAEAAEARRTPGLSGFADAVSAGAFKLMAYKDEYEVARLYASPEFTTKLGAAFEGAAKLRFHLAPPILTRIDARTGHPAKIAFGPWMLHVFKVLARLKGLRGTRFDPFGRTAERRAERAMIEDYVALVTQLRERLTPATHAIAASLAELPVEIRGFGHVKHAAMERADARRAELLARLGEAGRRDAA
jgi:indolepyruvate ferredoxin oxidoreductase